MIILNLILYQLIWFLCVLGGNMGAIAALPILLIHLLIIKTRGADLTMMAFMLFLGLLVDGTLHQVGFFAFTTTGFAIPLWLMVIWLGLAWLKNKPLFWTLFGAIGGPFAYWAGVRLGATSFNWPQMHALVTLAFIWAFIWALVMYFSVISTPDKPDPSSHASRENGAE